MIMINPLFIQEIPVKKTLTILPPDVFYYVDELPIIEKNGINRDFCSVCKRSGHGKRDCIILMNAMRNMRIQHASSQKRKLPLFMFIKRI